MVLIYWCLTIILHLILHNLSVIESAYGDDSSGIDPAFGEDSASEIEPTSGEAESGEDESGLKSGSGAGMF